MADDTNPSTTERAISGAGDLAMTLTRRSMAIYVAGQVIDLSTTYRLTPDLSREMNLISSHYGLGWAHILLAAVMSTVILLMASSWMWRLVVKRFPLGRTPYMQFYSCILFGTITGKHSDYQTVWIGALIGIACILSYALVASKLLTCGWNLLIMANDPPFLSTTSFLVLKYVLAVGVGLSMFFIFPYWLHRTIHEDIRTT